MFDERRQRVTGIDKSYPLQPISTKNVSNSSGRQAKNTVIVCEYIVVFHDTIRSSNRIVSDCDGGPHCCTCLIGIFVINIVFVCVFITRPLLSDLSTQIKMDSMKTR